MPIKKILVVDDSPTERQFMLEALSKLGYQVVLAESGEEGVAVSSLCGVEAKRQARIASGRACGVVSVCW